MYTVKYIADFFINGFPKNISFVLDEDKKMYKVTMDMNIVDGNGKIINGHVKCNVPTSFLSAIPLQVDDDNEICSLEVKGE